MWKGKNYVKRRKGFIGENGEKGKEGGDRGVTIRRNERDG
jgi:hypothetical protein